MPPEDTTSESDVNTGGDTSVTDSSASSEQSPQDAETQEAASTQETGSNVPFNDPKSPYHSRFKELHEQASSVKTELERERQERERMRSDYETRLAQIQQQIRPIQPTTKPYQQLFERLDKLGVDPEFAKLLKDQVDLMEKFPNIQQDLASLRAQREQQELRSGVDRLFSEYKVPAKQQKSYENALIAEAQRNPKLSVRDLDNVFKGIHDEFKKEREEWERETLKGYVKAKSSDKTPASTTGGQSTGTAPKKPKELTPEQYRAYVKSEFVKELRRGRGNSE